MNRLIAAFTAALILTAAISAYSDGVETNLQNNLIRLHIIANSNSDADQAVKLKVRDAVLKEGRQYLKKNSGSSPEIDSYMLSEIEDIADRVLAENGFTYSAKAYFGKFTFPRKTYSAFTLPAGEYRGVRLVLGSGAGENWWCVLYPPLCFSDGDCDSDREKLRSAVGDDSYDLITSDGTDVKIKFRVVEVVREIKQFAAR